MLSRFKTIFKISYIENSTCLKDLLQKRKIKLVLDYYVTIHPTSKYQLPKVILKSIFFITVVAEALERLLHQRYTYDMNKQSTQTVFECLPADPDFEYSEDVLRNIEHTSNKYEKYRNQVKAGLLGKTA